MHLNRAVLTVIIVFFLMCTTVSAFEFQYEEIWVHQGVFELSDDDKASAGKYTVKLHEIRPEDSEYSATVLFYVDGEFKETFFADADLNNEFLYDENLKVRTLAINETMIALEMYIHEYELVWIPERIINIGVGESYEMNGINIKAVEINDDVASIEVTKDEQSHSDEYITGNHHRYFEEVLIRLTYIDKIGQTITILPYQPGKPALNLEIQDLDMTYFPNEEPVFNILVKNEGTIPARGMTVTSSATNAQIETDSFEIPILDTSNYQITPVILTIPETPTGTDVEISVLVEGYDYKGNNYQTSTNAVTFVEPYIAISKTYDDSQLQEEIDVPEIFFTLLIFNNASIGHEVTVNDPIPPSFLPVDIASTQWNFFIGSGKSKTITYSVIPTAPGNFEILPAFANWYSQGETYSVNSEESGEITVNGTMLEVEKDVSLTDIYTGEEVDITINIRNVGTRDATVSFTENIPTGFEFVSGQRSWEGHIGVGEEEQIVYTMFAKEEATYELPVTKVAFEDESGTKGTFESKPMRLYVYSFGPIDSSKDQGIEYQPLTMKENILFLISSFITILCVLSTIPLIVYLYISRQQSNRRKRTQ
ncbi:DUF11 domain-containing protein [Methanococcoides burtonii]|nr:DUF11 domain-containing protein [Methanococcoides burtonii]